MSYKIRYKYTLYGEITNYSPTAELALQNMKEAYERELIGVGEHSERGDPDLEFECVSIVDEDSGEELPLAEQWTEEDDDFLTRKEQQQ